MLKRCIVYSIIRNYAYEINQERTQIRMIYSLTLRWLNTQKLPTEYSTDAVHVLTTAQSLKRCIRLSMRVQSCCMCTVYTVHLLSTFSHLR